MELSDEQIQNTVFAVLRRWGTDRAWERYTRETGPYDITELRPEVLEIIRAVLAVSSSQRSLISLAPTRAANTEE